MRQKPGPKPRSARDRLIDRLKLTETGCWEWRGKNRSRRGMLRDDDGRMVYAHRLSAQLFLDSPIEGLLVCHTCDNPMCCNPDHLFLGTQGDNMKDAAQKGRLGRLTLEDIKYIRKSGERSIDLSKRFNMSPSMISAIKHKRKRRFV